MEIKQLCKDAHETAKSKGFHDNERNVGELLMLCVSELSEALEAHRDPNLINISSKGKLDAVQYCKSEDVFKEKFEYYIKHSFEVEIADTFIRLADLCEHLNIDIEKFIEMKMKYNKTRQRLHGKRY